MSDMKDTIKNLCKENDVTVNQLEKSLGFGTGYISKLDKSNPTLDKVQSIADYFGVPITFIISGSDPVVIEARTDYELTKMNDRLKAYALKLNKLSSSKQELIEKMIDELEN